MTTLARESMMVDGRKCELIARRRCPCGGRADVFQILEPATPANPMQQRVRWESPPRCPSCEALHRIRAGRPDREARRMDRGVHRSVIMSVIEWRRSQGTLTANFEAEVLDEIAGATEGDWVPTASLTAHPHAAMIAHLVANMAGDATPPGSAFKLGPVEVRRAPYVNLLDRDLLLMLDRHCRLDHGEVGPEPEEVSVTSSWCQALATDPEMNFMALVDGDGPIRSLYHHSDLFSGRPIAVEIATFRRALKGSTLIWIGMR